MQDDPLTQALFDAYQRSGKDLNFWAHRFRNSLKKKGGLAVAKAMLNKKAAGGITEGFLKLVDANKPELSVESIILLPQFRGMFSQEERETAEIRLRQYFGNLGPQQIRNSIVYPDDLAERDDYCEGAVAKVLVNRYERNASARAASIEKHGARCKICSLRFQDFYGDIGKDFIHVHHVRPMATIRKEYKLNPETDLVPVCPNCHAMLHKREPPFSVHELKELLHKGVA
jgi:5-methylcytosine-specific restriction protein A